MRKGYKAALTGILNIIDKLITASQGADNRINRSEDNPLVIEWAFENLNTGMECLERLIIGLKHKSCSS